MISIVVQISGSGEEKRGSHVQNDLIVSDSQAVIVGTQKLFSFYHSKKERDIKTPYLNIVDGDIISIEILSIANNTTMHRVIEHTISISGEKGVTSSISLEGDYVPPVD